jgi:hypothetical protein
LARRQSWLRKEISVKRYVVRLSGEEREQLEALIRKGKSPARPMSRTPVKGGATAGSSRLWRPAHPWFIGCAMMERECERRCIDFLEIFRQAATAALRHRYPTPSTHA